MTGIRILLGARGVDGAAVQMIINARRLAKRSEFPTTNNLAPVQIGVLQAAFLLALNLPAGDIILSLFPIVR
jgi:hypothetical protein